MTSKNNPNRALRFSLWYADGIKDTSVYTNCWVWVRIVSIVLASYQPLRVKIPRTLLKRLTDTLVYAA
ncbi:hypothetical protein [Scytonema sp. PCC 10023]|uniref:hypothetical protein n=1 Tax=Scytonema sp. PCC 10023 TaxID=1680591 RepID=UPI0039C5CC24